MNYTLIRAKRRTLSLQLSPNGDLIARAPRLMPRFLIDRFVEEKSPWIAKTRQKLSRPQPPRVKYFSRSELEAFVTDQVKFYGDLMGLAPATLRFTEVRSYWGTCSPAKILSFNLALCFIPPEAVTYVVIHELAHLKWRGHGPRFWALVTKIYPQTKQMRALLRQTPRTI